MTPATLPRSRGEKLIVVSNESSVITDTDHLSEWVLPGDVWVVNDAATFPASLTGKTSAGVRIEVRLLPPTGIFWSAVLFGSGTWRDRTEDRRAPPLLEEGEGIDFDFDLGAKIRSVSPLSHRLVQLQFSLEGDALWKWIYSHGKPIQYSHHKSELGLWSVQTSFASRPWASEMPSAGRPLRSAVIASLRARGAKIHRITHAAGLTATGDPAIDGALPLPETYEIPRETVDAITTARMAGSRVIAVGTSVFRALEGCAKTSGDLRAGYGTTDFIAGPAHKRKIVDGILTGIHSPGESHFTLLRSFLMEHQLEEAAKLANHEGFLSHEFGDLALILRK